MVAALPRQRGNIRRRRDPARAGFTLVEVAIAIGIIGLGVVALMQLTTACTMQNRASAQMTSAGMLAEHVQELMSDLPLSDPTVGSTHFGLEPGESLAGFDDVDDFANQSFSPPIDSTRTALTDLADYTQTISVVPVAAREPGGNLTGATIPTTTYTGALRITVTITHPDSTGVSMSWIKVED
jgi:prepilin-type N-terminal cleavage/methylation domain-containing protein